MTYPQPPNSQAPGTPAPTPREPQPSATQARTTQTPTRKQTLGEMLQDPATWKALGRTDTWVALVAIIAIVGVVLLFKFILAFILDAAISTGGLPVAILIMLAGGGLYVWMKVVGRAPKKK